VVHEIRTPAAASVALGNIHIRTICGLQLGLLATGEKARSDSAVQEMLQLLWLPRAVSHR
jgi:hypothetical protein